MNSDSNNNNNQISQSNLEARIAVIENDIKNIRSTIVDVKCLLNKLTDLFTASHEALTVSIHRVNNVENKIVELNKRVDAIDTQVSNNTKKLYWIGGIASCIYIIIQHILPLFITK